MGKKAKLDDPEVLHKYFGQLLNGALRQGWQRRVKATFKSNGTWRNAYEMHFPDLPMYLVRRLFAKIAEHATKLVNKAGLPLFRRIHATEDQRRIYLWFQPA